MSFALTIVRDRSHDEYYFARPLEMVAGPLPPSYLSTSQKKIAQRVVLLEALRRSFMALRGQEGFDGGRNIHGQFGLVEDWEKNCQRVKAEIDRIRPDLNRLSENLLVGTKCNIQTQDLVEPGSVILQRISRVVVMKEGHPDLSQRLAENGLLPMFGFPSQLKNLYTHLPTLSKPWPPKKSVPRDGRLAISEFAPGNEIVVDKVVYRVIGCVGILPSSFGQPKFSVNHLGRKEAVALCDICRTIVESPGLACPNCGEAGDHFRRIDIVDPPGYRTDWSGKGEIYDRSVERLSRASVPRLAIGLKEMTDHSSQGFEVKSGTTKLFTVNDNNGSYFTFEDARAGRGSLEINSAPQEWKLSRSNDAPMVALASSVVSDVLVAHAKETRNGKWNHEIEISRNQANLLISTARRAAWTSLAFAFRIAASKMLDIEPPEMETGLRLIGSALGGLQPEIYLADTIANGAGYVSYLGTHFDDFLYAVEDVISTWESRPDHNCDTSCYSCLRDYSNGPYHPLLNWRLAADVFEIVRTGNPQRDRWVDIRRLAVEAAVKTFDGWSCADSTANRPIILTPKPLQIIHPLQAIIPQQGVLIGDFFNLNLRPGELYLTVS